MKKPLIAPTAIALAVAAGVSGVAATASAQSSHTLTVWLMTGEISTPVSNAVNAAFEKEFPGWTVNIEIQQWSGISTKLITALASTSPPDAMEIGNTDVAEFAASGGLEDLSSQKSSLPNSSNWLSGLSGPAEYHGGLYAVPLLAGDRVVVYNKAMFKAAGIRSAPNSLDQLINDGFALKARFSKVKDFSPLYLPGEYWYAGLPLIWAYGGQIATYSGGKWVGSLTSKASLAGLSEWETVQNALSISASRDVNTNAPDQDSVLAQGKAAMIVAGSWEPGAVLGYNKALKGDLGTFVFPGPTPGTPSPVFIGGSDIGIANASPNKAEALAWVSLMTNAQNQLNMVKTDGLMPNATSLLSVGASLPGEANFYKAAESSDFTPATPGWATVEADNVMETLFSDVAAGKQNVGQIAKSVDSQLDSLLNASVVEVQAPAMAVMANGRAEQAISPAPSYQRRSHRARRALRRQLLPFLLLLPALVLVGGVLGYPIGQLVATSFQQLGLFELIGHHVVWNGFANYRTVFASSQFLDSLEQTALFVVATVGLTMLIGTGVALLMGRLGKILRTVVSVALLLAWAMPSSAASIVWSWMFETEYGVVNYVAVSLGLHGFSNHDWFAGSLSAYTVVTAMIVWQAVPFVALSLYAALTLVPQDVLEAAAIDGAGPAVIFRRVIFPIVRPIFVLLTVLSVIWDGNVFNQVWYLTAGRAQVINVIPLGVWQYIEAFSSQQYGLGAAVAVVTVVLLLVVTGYYMRIMVRTGEAQA